jgi:hypothetical protein
MSNSSPRAFDFKKPSLDGCPKLFCSHWVEVRWGTNVRGRCMCEFGTCTRAGDGEGDKDFYEPEVDVLREHGLPWFFYMDPEELSPEQRRRYDKYFAREHHALLRPGVTGLRLVKRGAAPGWNEQAFLEQGYWLAQRCNGRVAETDTDVRSKSFAWVKIVPNGQNDQPPLYVLQNVVYPLIACAAKVAPFAMRWLEWPEEWQPFAPAGGGHGLVLDPTVLNTEPGLDWQIALSEPERVLIRRWRPASIGEIIYNFWDIERGY